MTRSIKLLRFATLIVIALLCIAVAIFGVINEVSFLYTFIGPAILLGIISINPRFLFDIIAVSMLLLLIIMAAIFSITIAIFNHQYFLAFIVLLIPTAALGILLYCMERFKKEDTLYP